jgi:hypothetical protein
LAIGNGIFYWIKTEFTRYSNSGGIFLLGFLLTYADLRFDRPENGNEIVLFCFQLARYRI